MGFSFKNNPKNLDLSYKMDLDLRDSPALFRKGETSIIAKFCGTDLVTCSHSRKRKTPTYNRINTLL